MALRNITLAAIVVGLLAGAGVAGREPAAPKPTGTLFVVDSRMDRVLVIDARTGAIHTVRPPGLAQCGPGLHAAGGRIVYVGSTSSSSNAYSVDPRPGGTRTRLGGAHELVPSETPGRVWLHTVPRCRDVDRMETLREVDLAGHTTARRRGRVPGFQLIGAVENGLVMFRRSGAIVAWNPTADRVLWERSSANVVATGGRFIAWRRHRGRDRVHVTLRREADLPDVEPLRSRA